MIRKGNFSNGFLSFWILIIGLSGCAKSKYILNYTTYYKSIACNGQHARALTVANDFIIAGGKTGFFSIHGADTTVLQNAHIEQIEGIEDFRDVYFDQNGTCLFLNSGDNGIIYSVRRTGQRDKVFDTTGVFLDGMAFWDKQSGIVYGDPIGNQFFLARTTNQGNTWQAFQPKTFPSALANEGGFAASGTGIQAIGDSTVYFATGLGEKARIYSSKDRGENWIVKDTPMKADGSFGIYSMFFWSENEGVIIGGSYEDTLYKKDVCQYTNNGGDSWSNRSKGLQGYCSCVHGTTDGNLLVATGRMGTFYSMNKGKSWSVLTETAYYSCFVTKSKIALLGRNGRLEVIDYSITVK